MNWGKGDLDICLHIKVLWTVHTPRTYVLTVYEAVAWSTTVLNLTGPQQGHKQHSFIVVTISQQLVTAEGNTIFHTLSQHEHTRLITTHITNHWYTLCLSTLCTFHRQPAHVHEAASFYYNYLHKQKFLCLCFPSSTRTCISI